MKRLIALLGILVLVGAIALPVLAHGPGWGRGHHMGWGGGPGQGYCGDYGPGAGNLTEEQRTKLDTLHKKFYDETAQLRNEMWTKSSELNALLNSPNPDADKARALQKEITGLKSQLAEKRLDFELATGVEGIDEEIALIRVKIKSLLERDPENMKLIVQAANTLERLVRTRYNISKEDKQGLKEAISTVLRDVALPLGISIGATINK